jgi:acylphosphatase
MTVPEIARRYFVSGRVQGVGFRYFVQDAAQREGVRGWVRNLGDGRVEAFAQGDADALARFEARVRQGPSMSRVVGVDIVEELPTFAAADFAVRPTAH